MSQPRIVVIGASHVHAIEQAWSPDTDPPVAFFNFWHVLQEGTPFPETVAAIGADLGDVSDVFVAFGGNQHNMLVGLTQHERPFSVGSATEGMVPVGMTDCDFIPRDVISMIMRKQLGRWRSAIAAVHKGFGGARFSHLMPPPPVRDVASVPRALDPTDAQIAVMAVFASFGAHPDLRREVYGIQIEESVQEARSRGAEVIEPPGGALTGDGFLDPAYCAAGDPTHGNARYGRLVLDQILGRVGVAA